MRASGASRSLRLAAAPAGSSLHSRFTGMLEVLYGFGQAQGTFRKSYHTSTEFWRESTARSFRHRVNDTGQAACQSPRLGIVISVGREGSSRMERTEQGFSDLNAHVNHPVCPSSLWKHVSMTKLREGLS